MRERRDSVESQSDGMYELQSKIDAVERSAAAAGAVFTCVPHVLAPARDKLLAGDALKEIAKELATAGRRPSQLIAKTYRDYERAVADLRTAVITALVDDDGVSLSQIAQVMGVSRQTVARLYYRSPHRGD